MSKFLSSSGILAVIVYSFATILGGILFPNYSHLYNTVSELTSNFSPTRDILNPIYFVYNLLVISFGYYMFKINKSKLAKLGAIGVIVTGLLGAIMWFFPQDTMGTPLTQKGAIHILLAGVVSLITLVWTLLFGFGLKKSMPGLSRYSFITFAIILVTGPIAGYLVASNSPIGGLMERIVIGSILAWLAVASFLLSKNTSKSR